MTSLTIIEELIKELITKVDILLEQKPQNIDYQNTVAAKIIHDISEKIDKCECNERFLGKLKEEPLDKKKERVFDLHKYSYPNFNVGNESLGSSGNPNAMTWPFGTKK